MPEFRRGDLPAESCARLPPQRPEAGGAERPASARAVRSVTTGYRSAVFRSKVPAHPRSGHGANHHSGIAAIRGVSARTPSRTRATAARWRPTRSPGMVTTWGPQVSVVQPELSVEAERAAPVRGAAARWEASAVIRDGGRCRRTGMMPSQWSARALAALLVGMGTLHLVTPAPFERLVPRWLGSPRAWVVATGLAEIASGAALVSAATRRVGAWAAAATLVVVFPGNLQMAVNAGAPTTLVAAALWLRLPLQAPLVAWALHHARRPEPLPTRPPLIWPSEGRGRGLTVSRPPTSPAIAPLRTSRPITPRDCGSRVSG